MRRYFLLPLLLLLASNAFAIPRPMLLPNNLASNHKFDSWSGDDPAGWTVTNEDGTHYVTEVAGGARYYSEATTPEMQLYTAVLTTGNIYEIEVVATITGGSLKCDTSFEGRDIKFTASGKTVYTGLKASADNFVLKRNAANTDVTIHYIRVTELNYDDVPNPANVSDADAEFTSTLVANGRYFIPKLAAAWELSPDWQIPGNNVRIYMEENAEITAETSEFTDGEDRLIRVTETDNVTIVGLGDGATISGDRGANVAGAHEHMHVVASMGATYLSLVNLTIEDAGGDNVYVGPNSAVKSEDIHLIDCYLDNAWRNNISLTDVDGFRAWGSTFTGATGTEPEAGVDFEPNDAADHLIDIVFDNCVFSDNDSKNIHFTLERLNESTDDISITIQNSTVSGGGAGIMMRDIYGVGDGGGGWETSPGGTITLSNIDVTDTGDAGFTSWQYYENLQIIIDDLSLVGVNTNTTVNAECTADKSPYYCCTGSGAGKCFDTPFIIKVTEDSGDTYTGQMHDITDLYIEDSLNRNILVADPYTASYSNFKTGSTGTYVNSSYTVSTSGTITGLTMTDVTP